MFDPAAELADYVEYALDVPMYFIQREQRLIDLTGRRFTFGEFLRGGYLTHQATLADWDLHLSTLFPEVRLRPQIEIRSADSLPPRFALAVGALLKGVLYDPQAAEDSWALFRDLAAPERDRLYRQAWRLGLRAPWRQGLLQELAVTVLQIARAGLQRQNRRNARGEDEAVFLDEIIALTSRGETLAQHLLERWHGCRAEKLALLRAHCGLA
ncbi:MAG: glutamate-cysteine ligase family protein [Desulfuromonadaceae bacterium]